MRKFLYYLIIVSCTVQSSLQAMLTPARSVPKVSKHRSGSRKSVASSSGMSIPQKITRPIPTVTAVRAKPSATVSRTAPSSPPTHKPSRRSSEPRRRRHGHVGRPVQFPGAGGFVPGFWRAPTRRSVAVPTPPRQRQSVRRVGSHSRKFVGKEKLIRIGQQGWQNSPWLFWFDAMPFWWGFNWWSAWWGNLIWDGHLPYYFWQGYEYPWYPIFGLGQEYAQLARNNDWQEIHEKVHNRIEELHRQMEYASNWNLIQEHQQQVQYLRELLGGIPQA